MNEPISQPTPDRLTIELRKPAHILAFTELHAKLKLDLGLDLTNTQVMMWLMANAKE